MPFLLAGLERCAVLGGAGAASSSPSHPTLGPVVSRVPRPSPGSRDFPCQGQLLDAGTRVRELGEWTWLLASGGSGFSNTLRMFSLSLSATSSCLTKILPWSLSDMFRFLPPSMPCAPRSFVTARARESATPCLQNLGDMAWTHEEIHQNR